MIQGEGRGKQHQASSSEPAPQPGTVVTLGSVLGRAGDLGTTALNAKQGPHLPWQLMDQLAFHLDTQAATGGNGQLHF